MLQLGKQGVCILSRNQFFNIYRKNGSAATNRQLRRVEKPQLLKGKAEKVHLADDAEKTHPAQEPPGPKQALRTKLPTAPKLFLS